MYNIHTYSILPQGFTLSVLKKLSCHCKCKLHTIANGDQKRLYNNTVSTVLYAREGAALRALLLGWWGVKRKIRTARAYEGIGKECQRAHDNPKRHCLLGKGAGDTGVLQSPYMGYFNYVQAWKQLFWLTSSCMCGVGTLLAAVEHGLPQMRSQEGAIYRDEDNEVMWCHMMSHDAIWLQ